MTANYQNLGDGIEYLMLVGPTGIATLTTWLHGEEVETLEGHASDPGDVDSFTTGKG